MAIFHIEAKGNIGNRMIQFLVAKALQKQIPNLVISNAIMPIWGIDYPDIQDKGRIYDFDESQHVPSALFRELFAGGLTDCIRYAGYGQRLENLPHWKQATQFFRAPESIARGFSNDHLVINIRGGEILDGRHLGYVLIPVHFYQDLVRRTGLQPVFMGQIEDNIYCDALRRAFPQAQFIPSGGVLHDFELLRRSVHVVPAVSTFSWLACWLSETVQTVFMPLTGLFNPLQFRDNDFAPTDDPRFRFFWFPANYGAPVASFEQDHLPLRGRTREIAHAELQRMKKENVARPKRLEDYTSQFDETFYQSRYADVREALKTGMSSGFHHYINWGFRENRQPLEVDWHWYVRTYPDAARDIGLGLYEDPVHHFISLGVRQGYQPVPPRSGVTAPTVAQTLANNGAVSSREKELAVGQICRVRTFHSTQLVADVHKGQVMHAARDWPNTVPVFGYRPSCNAPFIFLAAALPGNIPLSLRGQEAVGRLLVLRTTEMAKDGWIACYGAEHGRFLLGAPPASEESIGVMALDAELPNEYERIYLDEHSEHLPPQHLLDAVPVIEQWISGGAGDSNLLDLLSLSAGDEVLRDVLNAIGYLLSPQDWQQLAAALTEDETLVSSIEARYPEDLFAKFAVRPAAEFVHGQRKNSSASVSPLTTPRRSVATCELGPELDSLDHIGMRGEYVSFPAACAIATRRLALPKRRAAIIATARNEGLYILDWLAHHRAIGFDKILIYSNDNVDGSDALLAALAEAGEIYWRRSTVLSGTRPQWKAYHHALHCEPEILDCAWTLAIDLDEYFELNAEYFQSVSTYLDWAESHPVDSIAFNWVMIGSGGRTHWHDQPLRQRFPIGPRNGRDHSQTSDLVKAMFRTTRFPTSYPHHPVPYRLEEPIFRTSTMRPMTYDRGQGASYSSERTTSLAWISHFFFKSNEEFVYKFSRPRGDDLAAEGPIFSALTSHFVSSFVSAAQTIPQPHQIDSVDANAAKWRSHYEGLSDVRRAQAAIGSFYAGRLETLLPALRDATALREAEGAGEEFLAPLLRGLRR